MSEGHVTDLVTQFKAARSASVPILAIHTADQPAVATAIYKNARSSHPIVQWDIAAGLRPVCETKDEPSDAGAKLLMQLKVDWKADNPTVNFSHALHIAQQMPEMTVVICHNAPRVLIAQEPVAVAHNVQAVANLRDLFKQNYRMVVLMGPPFVLPPDLSHDTIVISDDLPGPDELRGIVQDIVDGTEGLESKPEGHELERVITAISGLSRFEAEQVIAMSLDKSGVDEERLWHRKKATIEATRGLKVHRGGERFEDLIGLDPLKEKLISMRDARTPVGAVIFIDEIDKVLANVESDQTGVRMDQLRTLLTEMEDNAWRGAVLVGVPGGGKSAIAKAMGTELSVPTVSMDLGDMEAPHVGESEALIRQAFAVVKAISRGNAFFLATSNASTVMRPELQRRFTDGFWFFDLMTDAQRAAAWEMYMREYELGSDEIPPSDGWTGAEIRNCCRAAWDARISLKEAAKFIIPMAQSRVNEVERLRETANGRFLDANNPGVYTYDRGVRTEKLRRAINLDVPIVGDMPES